MMLDLWLRSPSPLTQGRSETSMSEPDRTIRRPDRNVSADRYRYSELTHWLAADPDRLAEALNRHQPAGSNCADCHRP